MYTAHVMIGEGSPQVLIHSDLPSIDKLIFSHMHKFYIELAVGLLGVVAGIYATKSAGTIEWLWRGFASIAGKYTAWLCLGFASVLLGLALHEWMKVNGHQKWKRKAWAVVLTLVLLFSSWYIIGWLSSTKVDALQSQENRKQRDSLREKLQMGQREGAFLEGEDLHEMMLAGVRLNKAKLRGANLRKAMLAGADLRKANLEHADLQGAMLLGANLSDANLVNANFEEAMLLGAQLEGARIDGANFKNASVSQDQIDDACGKPSALSLDLRVPKPC